MSDRLTGTIELRPAHPDDKRALTRLGSSTPRVPPAPLLVVLRGGELRAAISLATGAAIADSQPPPPERARRLTPRLLPIETPPALRRLVAVRRSAAPARVAS